MPPRPTTPRVTLAGNLPARLVLRLTAAQARRLGVGGASGVRRRGWWATFKRWL